MALEATTILALYQAALGKGYIADETIDYERPYPGFDGQNPPRSDLAFKDEGPGQNWAYLEAKHYGLNGRAAAESDVKKLRRIQNRSQRWLFIYRVRRTDSHAQDLTDLLDQNFGSVLSVYANSSFPSVPKYQEAEGQCDLCLARVT